MSTGDYLSINMYIDYVKLTRPKHSHNALYSNPVEIRIATFHNVMRKSKSVEHKQAKNV